MRPEESVPIETVDRDEALTRRGSQRRLAPAPLESAALRAVILLGGTVRPSELSRSVGRSLLELPVRAGRSVLDLWHMQGEALAGSLENERLPLRIMIDGRSREPRVLADSLRVDVVVERDPAPFRGTGGVLRDVCTQYDDDDLVLVASAGQVLVEPLDDLVQELSNRGGDVALVAHGDGTPGGLMLIRCGVLQSLRSVGFLDLKEQVLPSLAANGHDIRIVHRERPTGIPVRSLDGYITAVRAYHRTTVQRLPLDEMEDAPLPEDWRPTFAVIEEGARVDPSATIHDSVVLSGAQVQAGAVVVRSVVCPGGVVRAGTTVADSVVAGQRERNQRRDA